MSEDRLDLWERRLAGVDAMTEDEQRDLHKRLLATIDDLVDARAAVGNLWGCWTEDLFYEARSRVDDQCDADPVFALLLRHYLAQEVYLLRQDLAADTRRHSRPHGRPRDQTSVARDGTEDRLTVVRRRHLADVSDGDGFDAFGPQPKPAWPPGQPGSFR